jgi:hypothetical protein
VRKGDYCAGIEYLVFDPDSIEHFLKAFVEYIDGRFEELHSVIGGENSLGDLEWISPGKSLTFSESQ